jgi:aminoglycoside phosphotransferase (APT) family kinase protein
VVRRIDPQYTLVRAWRLTGGVSALVMVLDIAAGDQSRKLLLRQHGAADLALNPQVASDEFRLLQHLHAAGMPVPAPVVVDQSGEVISSPYLVLEYVEGATVFAPENLPDFIRRCAATLADIHRAAVVIPSFLPDRAALWADDLSHRPDSLDDSLDEGRIRDALEGVWPLPQINASVLLHGDFWPGNLLWRDGQLVGVIDWENAAGGDPLSDVAISRLEMLWAFGREVMQDFTREYQTQMPHINFAHLPQWDLIAALCPMHHLAEWAAGWGAYGRPDVTEHTLREAHQWFVALALGRV